MSSNKEVQGVEYWKNRAQNDTKMDWSKEGKDWLEEYTQSISHPHRIKIIEELKKLDKFESVLEIGCNTGPNIQLIRENFPEIKDFEITGVDVNEDSIKKAKSDLPGVNWLVDDITQDIVILPIVDVVIVDAVLMYVGPKDIKDVIKRIATSAKKAIILIEWNDKSITGVVKDFHWARDYQVLLKKEGFKVTKNKLTKEDWPTKTWAKNGYIYTSLRA